MSLQNDNVYAVILAGGSGTRFWPKSRHKSPKQLCSIGDSELTMLELTLSRLEGFIPPERRIIVTHRDQAEDTRRIAGARCSHIIAEPEAKNTAAALALAALDIQKISKVSDPLMVSLHADSVIKDVQEFLRSIENGIRIADAGYLTLLGIVPQYPETGYGYIEKGDSLDPSKTDGKGWEVKSFREKPDLETATKFLESGRFHWNSGLFIWKTASIIKEFSLQMPQMLTTLQAAIKEQNRTFASMGPNALAPYYARLDKVAIDNGILENSTNVAVVDGDFGWQDVGSWAALDQCFSTDPDGNIKYGDIYTIDTNNTTIDTDGAFVATIGLEDMVVVSSKGAVLVCPKSRAQDVKIIVEYLKEKKRLDLT